MAERPRFMDDLAGVAGGAFSALAGIREEAESMIRARVDEAIRKLDLVRREDLDAVMEMAANARVGQEAAEARLAALEARLEGHLASMSGKAETGGSHAGGSHAGVAAAGGVPGASEADPASLPPPPHPHGHAPGHVSGHVSGHGDTSEVAPGTMPPHPGSAGAPGSAPSAGPGSPDRRPSGNPGSPDGMP